MHLVFFPRLQDLPSGNASEDAMYLRLLFGLKNEARNSVVSVNPQGLLNMEAPALRNRKHPWEALPVMIVNK